MKIKRFCVPLALILLVGLATGPGIAQEPKPAEKEALAPSGIRAVALGTAFTYQGRLTDAGGQPVDGLCDLQFSLWDDPVAGSQVGGAVDRPGEAVAHGLLTVALDFGEGVFTGPGRWLEIAVRCPAGGGTYATLSPRQALTAAPYALALPGLWTQQNDESPNLIGGYSGNWVTAGVQGATIGGGGWGGNPNWVSDRAGTVGGGNGNWVGDGDADPLTAQWATVAGGCNNEASGEDATVGGGWLNTATSMGSTVAGGELNDATDRWAAVGGGQSNQASGESATVAGGYDNAASGYSSAIGGGHGNQATSNEATVAGGYANAATNKWAAVGGGRSNEASGESATVAGGYDNAASGYSSAVGGGHGNQATSNEATVAGGWLNTAGNNWATVGGGTENTASGQRATVPGGYRAVASHYGEMAHASGGFAGAGDAQASFYVMRRLTTSSMVWEDLYLDGAGVRLTLASGRTVTFDILVAGRSDGDLSAGYHCWGVIERADNTTALIGWDCEVYGEEVDNWSARIQADDANDALSVQVRGAGQTIRWVATVRTAEVSYP